MTEETQVKDETKVAQVEAVPQEQNTKGGVATSDTSSSTPESVQQINWRQFRQEKEKIRKEKEEAQASAAKNAVEVSALKAAMEALLVNNVQQRNQDVEEVEETEDQKIEKKVKRYLEDERKKNEEAAREKEAAELIPNLRKFYPDFDMVCTSENIDYLEFHHPEIAAGYKNAPNNMETWSNIYKLVKKFVNNDSKRDQARIEKNLSKPQSMSQGGIAQTGDSAPMELSEKRRQDNWSRMQRIMKGGK